MQKMDVTTDPCHKITRRMITVESCVGLRVNRLIAETMLGSSPNHTSILWIGVKATHRAHNPELGVRFPNPQQNA